MLTSKNIRPTPVTPQTVFPNTALTFKDEAQTALFKDSVRIAH